MEVINLKPSVFIDKPILKQTIENKTNKNKKENCCANNLFDNWTKVEKHHSSVVK